MQTSQKSKERNNRLSLPPSHMGMGRPSKATQQRAWQHWTTTVAGGRRCLPAPAPTRLAGRKEKGKNSVAPFRARRPRPCPRPRQPTSASAIYVCVLPRRRTSCYVWNISFFRPGWPGLARWPASFACLLAFTHRTVSHFHLVVVYVRNGECESKQIMFCQLTGERRALAS